MAGIKLESFKGMSPGISDKNIAEQVATVATATRVKNGDVGVYYADSTALTFTQTGYIEGLWPLDRAAAQGGPYWLNWTESQTAQDVKKVDVVRGPIPGDTLERVYYTGAADSISSSNPLTDYKPKFTNIPLATTGATGNAYPKSWYFLGVPNPTTAPALTFSYSPAALGTLDLFSSSIINTNYTISQATTTSSFTIDSAIGNPASSLRMFQDCTQPTTPGSSCYLYLPADLGIVGKATQAKFDFIQYVSDPTPNAHQFEFRFATTAAGEGPLVYIIVSPNTAVFGIGYGADWNTVSSYMAPGTNTIFQNTFTGLAGSLPVTTTVEVTPAFNSVTKDWTSDVNIFVTLNNGSNSVSVNAGPIPAKYLVGNNIGFTYSNCTNGNAGLKSSVHIDNFGYNIDTNFIPQQTSYVVTAVDSLGEESGPSLPSQTFYNDASIIPTVSYTYTYPTTGYSINQMNLYRALTGTTTTQYQLDAEIAYPPITNPNAPPTWPTLTQGISGSNTINSFSYADTAPNSQLGATLVTDIYQPPPANGRNIISLANGITMISAGNQIFPSVQYQPYSYPESYALATDFPVIAMAAIDTTAIILTQESPYLVIGSDPTSLSMSKITSVRGCVSKRSVINWENFGVVYASNEGLVVVNNAGAQVITKDYITYREWQNYYPSTIIGVYHEGAYYGTYTDSSNVQHGFIFDPGYGGLGFISLSDLTFSMAYNESLTDQLYYTTTTGVTNTTGNANLNIFEGQRNVSNYTCRTYTWRSKVFQWPYQTSPLAGQVKFNTVAPPTGIQCTVNFYKNRETAPFYSYTPVVVNDDNRYDVEFVIPAVVAYEIQVEIVGNVPVNSIYFGESMDDI